MLACTLPNLFDGVGIIRKCFVDHAGVIRVLVPLICLLYAVGVFRMTVPLPIGMESFVRVSSEQRDRAFT